MKENLKIKILHVSNHGRITGELKGETFIYSPETGELELPEPIEKYRQLLIDNFTQTEMLRNLYKKEAERIEWKVREAICQTRYPNFKKIWKKCGWNKYEKIICQFLRDYEVPEDLRATMPYIR